MAKMIGLSRSLKIEWLNKTVEFIKLNMPEQEIKTALNEYLSFEIASPYTLRKTREILLNIWVRTSKNHRDIKSLALVLFDKGETEKLVCHWSMMLLAYPVFYDICSLIGRLTSLEDNFTGKQLKTKLFDMWGERTTLFHSTDKIFYTLKSLHVIQTIKPGNFTALKYKVTKAEVIELLVLVHMNLNNNAYCEISDISKAQEFFPFKFNILIELLHNSELFTLNNFGGKVVVSLAANYIA
jgi:hypothetical protein